MYPPSNRVRGKSPTGHALPASCRAALFALIAAAAALAGCTPAQYAEQADRAAYGVVDQKQRVDFGETKPFSIEYEPFVAGKDDEQQTPLLGGKPIPMGDEPVRVLTLAECLEVALRNSREFQNRKEDLYIEALALANERHDWSGFGGSIGGGGNKDVFEAEIERTITEPGEAENSAEAGADLTFTQRLAQGGVITLGAGLTLASDLLGLSSTEFGSELSATFFQPLWQGAWRGFAYEDLFRSERDMAISVLEFDRFTQTFSTDITTRYYRVLQRLDQLRNEQANIQRLELALKRTQVQVEGGEVSRIQQDQTEQNLLNARVRLTALAEQYRNELDQFKIDLGLPVEANVELDPEELVALGSMEPAPIPFVDEKVLFDLTDAAARRAAIEYDRINGDPGDDPVAQRVRSAVLQRKRTEAFERIRYELAAAATDRAIDIALHTRPDVLRELADVRDVSRDVEIAADKFNPSVNLELSISAPGAEPRRPFRVQFHRHTRRAQLVINYPLDQTDNRDAYREALIDEARTVRDYELFLDEVRLDVRDSYRRLVQARQTYDLERQNVVVAERRQKLAALEQAAGEASARDVLEAEDGLRNAQNGLTAALVTYETTRINFLASLGMLDVDQKGQYREREQPFLFTRLGERYGNVEDFCDFPD